MIAVSNNLSAESRLKYYNDYGHDYPSILVSFPKKTTVDGFISGDINQIELRKPGVISKIRDTVEEFLTTFEYGLYLAPVTV